MTAACDACLRLSGLVGLLAPRIAAALDRPGRVPSGVLALSPEELIGAVAGPRADTARAYLEGFDAAEARSAIDDAGLFAVCGHDAAYPDGLRELADPPVVLYLSAPPARLADLATDPVVTVVGARRASPYGLEAARMLGRGLAAAGVVVASGLALGIDAAAHEGALSVSGGLPLAVLACGADRAYPRRHRRLYERVRAEGVVVSELPPGTTPFRWSFPARNRIMAALAEMTVVVEAAERSGSLITAQFAQDLGRDVGAVPGRVTARVAAGSNRLLRDGASVVRSAEDVLDDVFGVGARAAASFDSDPSPALEAPLQRVLESVEAGLGAAAIARVEGIPAGEVRAALGRLETAGLVRRDGLGAYERASGS
jgi:DNA processing protein